MEKKEKKCIRCKTEYEKRINLRKEEKLICPKCLFQPNSICPNVYLFNTTIAVPDADDSIIVMRKTNRENVIQMLYERQHDFVSAIGHDGTAKVLSKLLDVDVPTNRINAKLRAGYDFAVAFKLRERLPEGVVLDEEALSKLEYDLYYMFYLTIDGKGVWGQKFYGGQLHELITNVEEKNEVAIKW